MTEIKIIKDLVIGCSGCHGEWIDYKKLKKLGRIWRQVLWDKREEAPNQIGVTCNIALIDKLFDLEPFFDITGENLK